jgi:RimJ/RimL family protein N-acetyltransferase
MIETERLFLRKPEPQDVAALYRMISDPEVMRFIDPTGRTGTFDDAVGRIDRYTVAWEADGFGMFMAVRKDTGTVVGRSGFLCWDNETWLHGSPRSEVGERAEIELGWMLERAAWGNGYAAEMALAVRDWGLANIEMRRLISLIHPDNLRSQTVAERIGERYQHDVVVQGDITVGLWQSAS